MVLHNHSVHIQTRHAETLAPHQAPLSSTRPLHPGNSAGGSCVQSMAQNTPPLVLPRARLFQGGNSAGNTGSPCFEKPAFGKGGGWGTQLRLITSPVPGPRGRVLEVFTGGVGSVSLEAFVCLCMAHNRGISRFKESQGESAALCRIEVGGGGGGCRSGRGQGAKTRGRDRAPGHMPPLDNGPSVYVNSSVPCQASAVVYRAAQTAQWTANPAQYPWAV